MWTMNLPIEYSYYKLSEDIETGSCMFRVKEIVDNKSARIWLEKFSRCTNSYWRISRTYPYSHRINLYKIDFRCVHNTDRRARGIKQTRHTGCPAELRIVVKRYVRNSRAAIPDILAKDFPGLVVIKNNHNHGDILHAGKEFPCAICPKKFSTLGCATRHMNHTHDTSILPSTNLRCVDCKNCICFPSVKSFRFHLSEKHDYCMEEEHFLFQSMKEFDSWKKDMEERTDSLYVKQRQAKTSFPLKRECYRCHKSAPFYYKDPRKSFRTDNDFKKLGFYCPSTITTVNYETHVKVRFIKQHYMHANDHMHSNLNEEEKNAISLKLQAAAALTEISNDFSNFNKEKAIQKCNIEDKNYGVCDSPIELMNDSDNFICDDFNNENEDTNNENSYLLEDSSEYVDDNQFDDNNSTQSESNELMMVIDSINGNSKSVSKSSNFHYEGFGNPDASKLKTEACFNEILDKIEELTNTLKRNRSYYKENVLHKLLKKVNHLVAISDLDKPILFKKEPNDIIPQITSSFISTDPNNIITLATPIAFISDEEHYRLQKIPKFVKIAPKPVPKKCTTPQIIYISANNR